MAQTGNVLIWGSAPDEGQVRRLDRTRRALQREVRTAMSKNPAIRLSSILVVGLCLSLGWGIRGNFGHEYGAAFAGCLGAIAACLVSGREDWRKRVMYFALFGALGWGFGGSISYMKVIGYTHSGHAPTQFYGFIGLAYIGFLWAALGGAGTALPAVADADRLTRFFRPLLFVFGAWGLLAAFQEPLARALQAVPGGFDDRWHRHENPLYWLDADYLPAFTALAALCVYDLVSRRSWNVVLLPLFGAAGYYGGWGVQELLRMQGLEAAVGAALTMPLGDPELYDPELLLTNWPQFFHDYPQHIGWLVGLIAGIGAYFALFGKFRDGASLFVHMAVGWIAFFVIFPVLGSLLFRDLGGFRMTPPRSDDWAGITGAFVGMAIWMCRNGLPQVAFASIVSGSIGAIGFSGAQFLKLMAIAPGNPARLRMQGITPEGAPAAYEKAVSAWSAWHAQNWHSFLEQSYGFINGLAIAVALACLVRRTAGRDDVPVERRWTGAVAAMFVLVLLPFLNLQKNVRMWAEQLDPAVWVRTVEAHGASFELPAAWPVPYLGYLPGYEHFAMTPQAWYGLSWLLIAIVFMFAAARHLERPLPLLPASALGRGQLLLLALMWGMVIGNFERALPGWHPVRLLTEWGVFASTILATLIILLAPREREDVIVDPHASFAGKCWGAWSVGLAVVLVLASAFHYGNRMVYGDEHSGHSSRELRFGPLAGWRVDPVLKQAEHR